MSKASLPGTDETVEAAAAASAGAAKAFDGFAMPAPVRTLAEIGMTRARDTYETCKTIANDSSAMVETTFDAISRNSADINRSALHALKSSVADGFDHLEALMGARSFAEAIELTTAFARRRFEDLTDEAKAFQGRIGKAIEETATPARDTLTRTLATVKAAF